MTDDERRLYDSTVHGLRTQGWTKAEAEGEALARLDLKRQRDRERGPSSPHL